MSNQGHGQGPHDHHQALGNNNPWADQHSQQQQQQQYQQPLSQQTQHAPGGGPPRRAETFKESSFVPEAERGEQREAMEQFEMARSKPESQAERDIASLQREFPAIDGSLIAALYSDAQNYGATKETLVELNGQNSGQ